MKKLGKSLLLASLVMGGVKADTSTNKTFLAPRPTGVNLAMEGTTWHTQVNLPQDNDDRFGASLQAVGFYQENTSDNAKDLGKYFGFDNLRTMVVGNAGVTGVHIDKRHLLHNHLGQWWPSALAGTLNLEATHEAAGLRLDYYQGLDGLVKGLYFKVRAPIIWEETRMNLGLSNSTSTTINANSTGAGAGAYPFYDGMNSATVNIGDYFSGSITQSDAEAPATGSRTTGNFGSNYQKALTHAKIFGKHSETALADIDLLLGWNFWETEDNHASINIGATFPTSPDPDGVFVWEAQGGNRGHWALGAGVDAKFKPWKNEDQCLEIDVVFDWRYLFEDSEKRTLGIKGKKWGQYFMLGETGVKGVMPAANVLTQNVDVRPGNQLDARFGLAYRYCNFTADLGYNLYARESERVKLKEAWNDAKYGIAGNNYDAAGNFIVNDIAGTTHNIAATATRANSTSSTWLRKTDLDVIPAETPSQVTHKIYGGLGYAWNNWDTPVMLGIGAHYEFASNQKSLETWGIWGKLGISV